ncbi:MAG: nucleoside hydrolase [Verrucomicrobiota bacterium]
MWKPNDRVQLILDTDIGNDIDDSWALAFLLESPEVDLKYIMAATGDTEYRARVIAKMLQTAERTDIPVGMGRPTPDHGKTLEEWVEDFRWQTYPGPFPQNGVERMVRAAMELDEPTILSIGPMTNIAEALELEPALAERCRLVAMSGSLEKHEDGREGQIAEWNVRGDIAAAQKVYSAPWKSMRITPLDSCGALRLSGDGLRRIQVSDNPLTQTLMNSVDCWLDNMDIKRRWPETSPILFDAVAAYLCFATDLLEMVQMNILIDNEGFMRQSPQGAPVECAIGWRNEDGFKELLSRRLASGEPVRIPVAVGT